jgi:hypothetical protein
MENDYLLSCVLVTGYWGEVVDPGNAAAWGFASGVAYFLIVYEIWIGEAAKLAKAAGGNTCTQNTMLVRTCRMGKP